METEKGIDKMNKIEVMPIDVSQCEVAERETNEVMQAVEAIDIKDQPSYESTATIRKSANAKVKELDIERKKLKDPIIEAGKRIDDLFRKPIDMCKKVVQTCDVMMLTWSDLQEKKRKKEQDRLNEIAEKKRIAAEAKADKAREEGDDTKAEKYEEKAAEVIAPVAQESTEKPKGVSYITRYSGEVTDFSILPDAYKMVDQSMLNKTIQAQKGTLPIPGVKITSSKTVSTRG